MHRVGLEPTTPFAQTLVGKGLTETPNPPQTKYETRSTRETPADPDLASLVAAWQDLPEPIKALILGIVEAIDLTDVDR